MVYICCRNVAAAASIMKIDPSYERRVTVLKMDLQSIPSITECADEILRRESENSIDLLVCNAGLLAILLQPASKRSMLYVSGVMAVPNLERNEYGW